MRSEGGPTYDTLACHFIKCTLQMVKQAVPPGAMHRAVCEVDPTVPSVRLTTVDATLAGTLANRRFYAVAVWRESPFFTPRERAALAWTEALTRLSETHAPDEDYAQLAEQFSERERVDLTLAISTINSWNRLAVGFRKRPSE